MAESTDANKAFQEQYRLLRESYAARIAEKMAEINDVWNQLQTSGWNAEQAALLHRRVHSISGSGSTFGFVALSGAARRFEDDLQIVLKNAPPSAEIREKLHAQLTDLQRIAEYAVEDTQDAAKASIPAPSSAYRPATKDVAPRGQGEKNIFIISGDTAAAADIETQIGHFGYAVQTYQSIDEVAVAPGAAPPSSVILEGSFADTQPDKVAGLRQMLPGGEALPFIFISARKDLTARLRAARAGGAAYFVKPLDVNALVDKLDALTSAEVPEPYRVLVVDDDEELARHHANILRGAGMLTEIVNEPLKALDQLGEFRPDLILTDVYMPTCTGLELAAVVRQQEDYVSVPIVFLSTETNLEKQMAAMHLGGDDFLTKPIQPAHLVSAVASRVQRTRILRSFMMRDSLTGLLNHTSTREQLEIEVARAHRLGNGLAMAMLDLDRFKAINDSYGHPTGDRVIKSLARLLQQRLRRVDVIGRYGGEEFAVVLTNTDAHSAVRVLDKIRNDFSMIRQHCNGEEFFATFSCGVAALPDFSDATSLGNAADQALYKAKHGGRNRTVLVNG